MNKWMSDMQSVVSGINFLFHAVSLGRLNLLIRLISP